VSSRNEHLQAITTDEQPLQSPQLEARLDALERLIAKDKEPSLFD